MPHLKLLPEHGCYTEFESIKQAKAHTVQYKQANSTQSIWYIVLLATNPGVVTLTVHNDRTCHAPIKDMK